jgi:pseudouridine-5'-phosphate glycosidase
MYLKVAPEIRRALQGGRPVVALESTIITHGMPYPENLETARSLESQVRAGGAVPATIAVIGGVINAPDGFIANRTESDLCTGNWILLAARQDGSFTIQNGRGNAAKVYR